MIDSFADLTKDHFFIHVDTERVKRETLMTIARGFLSVSLLSAMSYDCVPGIEGAHFGLNYGFNKLRFVSPVPVNSKIRGHFTLKDIEKNDTGEITMIYDVIVELKTKKNLSWPPSGSQKRLFKLQSLKFKDCTKKFVW